MGTYGKKIISLDIDQLIELLNKALADEWLAYYQYWIGARVVRGLTAERVAVELEEHATEELRHANMLAERILQLGGVPLLDPKEWEKKTSCGYQAPLDFNEKKILEQNIKGEQCAIETYKKILDFVKEKDELTYHIVLEIFKDEVKHEDDLENLLEQIV